MIGWKFEAKLFLGKYVGSGSASVARAKISTFCDILSKDFLTTLSFVSKIK